MVMFYTYIDRVLFEFGQQFSAARQMTFVCKKTRIVASNKVGSKLVSTYVNIASADSSS